MKKQLSLILAAVVASGAVYAEKPTVTLVDEVLTVDTLFHAKVGPGTTQTSLHLSGAHPLNVFYLTVDKTTPGLSFRVVNGEKLAGNMRVSAMSEKYSDERNLYFSGVNGDFYWTSGKASNGSSQVGTPTNATIVDGEVYKSSNGSYQFTIDENNIPRIGRLDFYRGVATCGDMTAEFHGMNEGSSNNAVTLYTHRFWGSTNQQSHAGNCAEVTAKLVDGEAYKAGRKFKLEITSEPNSTGDTAIPDDGFVLFGRGNSAGAGNTAAKAFVEKLKPGDIVEIDNAIFCDGEQIYPLQCVSGNPKNVGGGVNLNSEAERGDAKDRHPRTGIGFSADGNKIVMMVIDGRGASAGVSTGMLGDMMIYAGCHEAVNLDGGGSSTLYTRALGVRNRCSDGSERAVSNGIFAVMEGEIADQEVAEIQFADWRFFCPPLGIYTPRVFAFNAAGVMIDNDYKGYTLSCEASLGEISADGKSLYSLDAGKGVLTATVGNAKASIPVYIAESAIAPILSRVILDGKKPYTVGLQAVVGDNIVPVRAANFDWESSDTSVATVDAEGNVTAVAEGTATLTGKYGEQTVSMTVDVQFPKAPTVPMAEGPAAWKTSKSALSSLTLSALGDGLRLDYKMAATVRLPKITLQYKKDLYSRPTGLHILASDYASAPATITVNLRAANDSKNPITLTCPEIGAESTDWTINFSDIFNVDDDGIYPIYVSNIAIEPSDLANQEGFIDFSKLEVVYAGSEAVEDVAVENAAGGPAAWYDLRGVRIDPEVAAPGFYIVRNGAKVSKVVVGRK